MTHININIRGTLPYDFGRASAGRGQLKGGSGVLVVIINGNNGNHSNTSTTNTN